MKKMSSDNIRRVQSLFFTYSSLDYLFCMCFAENSFMPFEFMQFPCSIQDFTALIASSYRITFPFPVILHHNFPVLDMCLHTLLQYTAGQHTRFSATAWFYHGSSPWAQCKLSLPQIYSRRIKLSPTRMLSLCILSSQFFLYGFCLRWQHNSIVQSVRLFCLCWHLPPLQLSKLAVPDTPISENIAPSLFPHKERSYIFIPLNKATSF